MSHPFHAAAPRSVLIVEDDGAIVELLRAILAPLAGKVEALEDLAPAMARLAGEAPDLVILDVVLPSGDGLEFCRAARARARDGWADVPMLVLTARPAPRQMAIAFEAGADDYVEKPFDLDALEGKMSSLIRLAGRCRDIEAERDWSEAVRDHLPSGLLVIDRDGRVQSVNPLGADILGVDALDVCGRPIDVVAPKLAESLTSSADQSEARVRVGDEERLVGFTVAPLGDGGQVILFRELATLERLRHAERNAARFVHEIRNPLTAIRAAVTLVGRTELAQERRDRLAHAAAGEVDRVVGLADEYLAGRRTRTIVRDGVEVAALLSEIVDLNLLGIEPRPRVAVAAAPDLPRLRGDPARLRQVVLNLLLNAIEVTRATAGEIRIFAKPEDGGVVLEVSDDGPGIAREILPRIFDENFTTRPTGDGIGLAIVRQIVDEEGGWIDVRTAVGAGTTFRVWLPSA